MRYKSADLFPAQYPRRWVSLAAISKKGPFGDSTTAHESLQVREGSWAAIRRLGRLHSEPNRGKGRPISGAISALAHTPLILPIISATLIRD